MTKLKLTLALIGAFVSGGAVGAVAMRSYLKDYYENMADEAIREARVALIRRNREHADKEDTDVEEAKASTDETSTDVAAPEVSDSSFDSFGRQTEAPEFDRDGYSRYIDKYAGESPDDDKISLEELAKKREKIFDDKFIEGTEDDEMEKEFMSQEMEEDFVGRTEDIDVYQKDLDGGQAEGDPNGRAPYEISEREYSYGDRSFGKACLTFYEKDRILCDDDGQPCDINEYVGRRCIARLKDEDAVYIRNERKGMDYEVVLLEEWFNEPGDEEES